MVVADSVHVVVSLWWQVWRVCGPGWVRAPARNLTRGFIGQARGRCFVSVIENDGRSEIWSWLISGKWAMKCIFPGVWVTVLGACGF